MACVIPGQYQGCNDGTALVPDFRLPIHRIAPGLLDLEGSLVLPCETTLVWYCGRRLSSVHGNFPVAASAISSQLSWSERRVAMVWDCRTCFWSVCWEDRASLAEPAFRATLLRVRCSQGSEQGPLGEDVQPTANGVRPAEESMLKADPDARS